MKSTSFIALCMLLNNDTNALKSHHKMALKHKVMNSIASHSRVDPVIPVTPVTPPPPVDSAPDLNVKAGGATTAEIEAAAAKALAANKEATDAAAAVKAASDAAAALEAQVLAD